MENNAIKEEWIDGALMMSPRPQDNHINIGGRVYLELFKYFKGKCEVRIEGALFLTKEDPKELKKDLIKLKELVTSKKAELVPDIAVYCDKEQRFRRGFLGVPQLVVEILSPSNSTDDTIIKKAIYEKFGVPEYWIINPHTKQVFIHSIEEGKYELKRTYNFLEDDIRSYRFEDLNFDIKDIELYEEDEFDF